MPTSTREKYKQCGPMWASAPTKSNKNERRINFMKFVKGMIIGTMVAAGVAMMYNDGMMNKKRMMKRGKQLAKKLGAF